MNFLLTPLILVLLTLSTGHALFPTGERAVVIRIDDIQDYGQPSPYAQPEKALLQYHIRQNIPAFIAIISSRFEKDPQLIDQIKEGIQKEIFTVGIHGWHHEIFSNLSRTIQDDKMRYGKNKLEAILGVRILAFVPPYDKYNYDTIEALRRNGLTLISSSTYEGDVPREDGGIVFMPRTVTTAEVVSQTDSWVQLPLDSMIEQIKNSWSSYGVAVIVIHPRQFVSENSEDRFRIYTQLIDWIQTNKGRIIRPEPPSPAAALNLDPLLLSVGMFTGLVSTLLIAFNVSSKRSNKKILKSNA